MFFLLTIHNEYIHIYNIYTCIYLSLHNYTSLSHCMQSTTRILDVNCCFKKIWVFKKQRCRYMFWKEINYHSLQTETCVSLSIPLKFLNFQTKKFHLFKSVEYKVLTWNKKECPKHEMLRGSGRYLDKDKSLVNYKKNCTKMLLKPTNIKETVDLI